MLAVWLGPYLFRFARRAPPAPLNTPEVTPRPGTLAAARAGKFNGELGRFLGLVLPTAAANVPRRETEADVDAPPPSLYGDDSARELAKKAQVPEAAQRELDEAHGKAARLERDAARQAAENARLAAELESSNAAILETLRSAAPENALWAEMLGHSAARR